MGGGVGRVPLVEEATAGDVDEIRVVRSIEVAAAVVAAAVVGTVEEEAAEAVAPVVVSSHAVAPAPLVLPAGHAVQPPHLAALYFPAAQIVHTAVPPTE